MLFSRLISFEPLSTFKSVTACFVMGAAYVGSLYLWRHENRYKRNEPDVIRRRFVSVGISCVFSLGLLYVLGEDESKVSGVVEFFSLSDWIGLRLDAPGPIFRSTLVSVALTLVLFAGPIVQFAVARRNYFNSSSSSFRANGFSANAAAATNNKLISPFGRVKELAKEVRNRMSNLVFLRNYLISPFTEEFVFRSCMLPLLVPRLGTRTSILVTPLFFGLAHLHHIVEGLMTDSGSFGHLLAQHLFQFAYTYVFGLFSSYLFVRTGCLAPSFVSHALCNFLGFPHIDELFSRSSGLTRATRLFILAFYVAGFVLFFRLLAPITRPDLFDNHIYLKFLS